MGFATWLNTYEMAYHFWEAFHWGKLDDVVPFPLANPLPTDFQLLCPNFIKGDAEEVT